MYRKVLFHTQAIGCLIKGFFPEALIYFIITTSGSNTVGNVAWWWTTGSDRNDTALKWAVINTNIDFSFWLLYMECIKCHHGDPSSVLVQLIMRPGPTSISDPAARWRETQYLDSEYTNFKLTSAFSTFSFLSKFLFLFDGQNTQLKGLFSSHPLFLNYHIVLWLWVR